MRTTLALALAAIVLPAAAAGAPPHNRGHLRPQTPAAADLVDRAIADVPEVAALVRALDDSNVYVYVTESAVGGPGDPPAYLRFITTTAGRRMLLVRIDRWTILPRDRIAVLAHELQHAVEIAAHPEVRDAHTMADLYRRIGWQTTHGCFETDAARDMTTLVRRRLAGLPR
jgi:hypothetical protein